MCIAEKECKEYEWCWKSEEWNIDCGSESVFVQAGKKGRMDDEEKETREKNKISVRITKPFVF